MNVLNKKEFYTYPEFMDDENMPIVGEVWCDNENSLPSVTEFSGYRLITGSKAYAPNKTYVLSGTTWVLQDQSPFSNVYTKTEVNNITDAIAADVCNLQNDVSNLTTSNDNHSVYLYALIGQSPLNKIDSSVWSGATTAGSGYICQDLAINLPAGNYIWKLKRDGNTQTSFVIKAADNTELYRVTRGAGVNDITQSFTISGTGAKVSIYVGYSINYSDNMIFSNLITSQNRSIRQIDDVNEDDDVRDER